MTKKYTAKQKKMLVNAFTQGKKHLNVSGRVDDKWLHICFAIEEAMELKEISPEACKVAKDLIAKRLAPYTSINHYVDSEVTKGKYVRVTEKQLQTFRHAWLDSLIQEFSN